MKTVSDQHLLALTESLQESIILRTREIEASKEELRKAKEAAESANKAKTQFLSKVSHELRTPLNTIIGLTNLMLKKEQEKEATEYTTYIQQAAQNLLHLVNDLLDLGKIEAGKLILEKEQFELKELINNIQNLFKYKLTTEKVALMVKVDNNIPSILQGDHHKLNQILINLLSNAFKFTSQGQVSLQVKEKQRLRNITYLEFIVSDTGCGIPEQQLKTIFESYVQAAQDRMTKQLGTGLGLHIVKQFIDLMDGELSVTSQLGVGSTFTFVLPFPIIILEPALFEAQNQKSIVPIDSIAPICPKSLPTSTTTSSSTSNSAKQSTLNIEALKGIKILVVEDEMMNQFVAKKTLTNWGILVTIADNGKKAIDLLEQKNFDIVLMDISMPEMDGLTAARKIRASEKVLNNQVPIFAFTANAFEQTHKMVLEAGMDGYVTKPFELESLQQKLLGIIEQ